MDFTTRLNKLVEIGTLRGTIEQMEDRRATVIAAMTAQVKAIDAEVEGLDRQLKKAVAKLTGAISE